MATAADYRRLLVQARRRQLEAARENIQRLAQTYEDAAKSIAAKIAALPDKESVSLAEWSRAQFQLLRDTDEALGALKKDYAGLLDLSLLDSAQVTADRERQVAALVAAREDPNLFPDLNRSVRLSSGVDVTVQFGRLAESAVEAITARVYKDGLRLSDRLYRLDAATRKAVEDTLIQGVTEGVSARELAARMQSSLIEAGAANPRYQAMRIARTEVNNAHREATVRSTIDPGTGTLKPYISGLKWNLSMSHPVPDICDAWASGGSDGLPPGVYLPADVPVDHPHGLCYITAELVDFPGIGGPGKAPDMASVPQSQLQYYAGQGDAVAQAQLAAGAVPA